MAWQDKVIQRLRKVGFRSGRSLLIALWELWQQCDAEARNHFEHQRLDIVRAAAERITSLPDPDELFLELFQMETREFVHKVAILTAQLDVLESEGNDWGQLPVQSVSRDGDCWVNMIKRVRPIQDNSPRILQGDPIKTLFRNMKIVPEYVADDVKVDFLPCYPPVDRTTDGRATLATLDPPVNPKTIAGGYQTRIRYEPTVTTARGRPTTIALPVVSEGGEARLKTALEACPDTALHPSIVVFPELSIDSKISDQFRRALQKNKRRQMKSLTLICPGTFHIEVDSGKYCNHADLYDASNGQIILSQQKFRFFKDTESEPPVDEAMDTNIKAKVSVLPTTFGTVAILICRDFGDEKTRRLIEDLDLDYVLVPSMGKASTASMIRKQAEFCCRETGGSVIWSMQTPPDNDTMTWVKDQDTSLQRAVFYMAQNGRVMTCLDCVYPT